jgi:hypothetical protein
MTGLGDSIRDYLKSSLGYSFEENVYLLIAFHIFWVVI